MYYFTAETISDYILTTGDTRNPLTRREFDKTLLKKLEGITNKKILKHIQEIKQREEHARSIVALYEYFESKIYDACAEILSECSQVDTSPGQKIIVTKVIFRFNLVPSFLAYMDAIVTYNNDNWEEMCRDKLGNVVSHLQSHILSQLYYEETILELVQRDLCAVVDARIEIIKGNHENPVVVPMLQAAPADLS